MQLIWLRHGETDENASGRYLGHRDVPLNQKGSIQAERLALHLTAFPVDRVYTSDLLRARQTARVFLRRFPHLPCLESENLRELSFGDWEGCTYHEISAKNPEHVRQWLSNPFQVAPPAGESLREMDKRLSRWLKQVEERHAGERIAVFTHGGPIRWFLAKLVYRDWAAFWKPSVPHGSGQLVKKQGDTWKIVSTF
ncbi:histidine phosphatase family protein [Lihuaxuella thermophila]|uniref:Alpha-ribazole phosphatase n=1 Tax=Lihuaxuella thermophila TaxID=1173111 RepID=A0A1H8AHC7_9BACL|nr:histidine phosphatase family protein [Lihuaxuella thermophila]SEM69209.1 alpha-ribazole phosphatase [Lihuaxuella thermophila]